MDRMLHAGKKQSGDGNDEAWGYNNSRQQQSRTLLLPKIHAAAAAPFATMAEEPASQPSQRCNNKRSVHRL